MTLLSEALRTHADLPEGATAQDLIAKLDEDDLTVLDGLLESQDSRLSAQQSLADLQSYTIEIIEQTETPKLGFIKIIVESCALPVLIGFIDRSELASPVTGLENLLFWIAVDSRGPTHNEWTDKDGAPVIDWRSAVAGKAVIAIPTNLDPVPIRRLLAALFSLHHADLPVSSVQTTLKDSAAGVTLRNDAASYSETQSRLIFEAISETNPKWRCLSFYRILENAYLNNIKRILIANFDFDAKTALTTAQKNVSSEVQQLITLATTLTMQAEFLKFNNDFELLIQADNNFIKAIDNNAREDRDLYGHIEIWRKAVLRFYKLRCSIAHGGTSSVIYEQFADANIAALSLLPSIEDLAFKSLNIEITY
ncbi:hypothetical protein D9M69_433570 [compost metagenome]|uniref:hypothetical protein n=1 Tax=Ectopseudomonas mendocina TaxID=300 RepID=UPI001AE0BB08|nr:hypothetical protein [Pseudomonas mendocina]QTN47321.1 hypothetical protein H7683_06760 [Pseudomonas mendocina]